MKKYLLLFLIFGVSFISNNVKAFGVTVTPNLEVTADPDGSRWRWRNDNSADLTILNSTNWLTSLNTLVIPSAELRPIYRVRMGQNFQIRAYLTSNSSNVNGTYAFITKFTLGSPVSFVAYFKEHNVGDYKQIPTSMNSSDAIYMRLSATGLSDGTTIPQFEETGRVVLPRYDSAKRPAIPYYFIGGKYYGSISSSSNVGTFTNYTNITHTVAGDAFLNSSGIPSYTSAKQYVNFGAEFETSIGFSNAVKPNTQYDIKITVKVPFSGTGYSSYYGSSNTQDFSGNFSQDIYGVFKTPATVLPVTLKAFVATKQGTSALLNWVTASEINNKGFYVQRSTDGKSFSNLGFVSSLASGGNSNTTLNYSYTDATPGTGAVYYRLNQVDLDGTSKYSDIQSLFMGSSSADVMVAPNPVITNVNLNNAQVGADYAIYSMSGQLVKSGKVSASVMSIDASNLPSGMYVIKTSTNAGAPVFKKFIKK